MKAGTSKSKEPEIKLICGNNYEKTCVEEKYPRAVEELKRFELWNNVYSLIPGLPKSVNKTNYLVLSTSRQTPNKILQEKIL